MLCFKYWWIFIWNLLLDTQVIKFCYSFFFFVIYQCPILLIIDYIIHHFHHHIYIYILLKKDKALDASLDWHDRAEMFVTLSWLLRRNLGSKLHYEMHDRVVIITVFIFLLAFYTEIFYLFSINIKFNARESGILENKMFCLYMWMYINLFSYWYIWTT